nr:hypothetical protein K-LCC10_0118 [Kaumoebavirus]
MSTHIKKIFPDIYGILLEHFPDDIIGEILNYVFDNEHPIFKKMVPVVKYGSYVPANGKIYFTHNLIVGDSQFERIYDDSGKYCGASVRQNDIVKDWFRFCPGDMYKYHSKFSTKIVDNRLIWERKN